MITQIQNFEELTSEACSYLTFLSYSERSVVRFIRIWQDVYRYMNENEIQCYDGNVGTQYLVAKSKLLSGQEKRRIRAVSILSDFQKERMIRKKIKAVSGARFEGAIGKLMSDYIDHLKHASNLEQQTIKCSTRQLSIFLNYLNIRQIVSLDKLDQNCLMGFVNSLDGYNVESKHSTLLKIKQFFKHLYDRQILLTDYCQLIPPYKFTKQRRLPALLRSLKTIMSE